MKENLYDTCDTHIILQLAGKSVINADSTSSKHILPFSLFHTYTYDDGGTEGIQ